MNVVTRIPPSPTGRFHIGTARTALFNFLFARHHEGKFIFRSEDTDRTRSKKEFEDELIAGMHWLGLTYDEFSRQTENAERHAKLLTKLLEEGKAYITKEPSNEDPSKHIELVRLKNPGTVITFHDEVHGDISFDTTELKDFVIARSLDDPLYHFAVVADDWDSGVTHVIRGEDHISNTPRQILIQEALGAPRPIYAHLPLILDEKRAKLSKRTGATSVMDYKDEGFMPEALVNYLALLGWNPGGNREDFSLNELIEVFSLEGIQTSGASWDRQKLLSVNQRWMRKLSAGEYISRGDLEPGAEIAVPLLKERAQTFTEARNLLATELRCLFDAPILDKNTLIAKEPAGGKKTEEYLTRLLDLVGVITDHAPPEEVKASIMPYADQEGRAAVLWPLRYALSGQERSPDPFTLISLLGTPESISRITAAIAILE